MGALRTRGWASSWAACASCPVHRLQGCGPGRPSSRTARLQPCPGEPAAARRAARAARRSCNCRGARRQPAAQVNPRSCSSRPALRQRPRSHHEQERAARSQPGSSACSCCLAGGGGLQQPGRQAEATAGSHAARCATSSPTDQREKLLKARGPRSARSCPTHSARAPGRPPRQLHINGGAQPGDTPTWSAAGRSRQSLQEALASCSSPPAARSSRCPAHRGEVPFLAPRPCTWPGHTAAAAAMQRRRRP
jgi:hypothetical protein